VPRGRPGLAAARRIAAGAFLFAGLFVLCFGVGNDRQAVMVAGAAITLLAVGVRLASSLRRTPRRWIRGSGYVLEASEPPTDSQFGRCTIRLMLDVPGLPRDRVTIHDSRVSVEQWPQPGQELPIQVAADDVRNLRVLWRSVPVDETATQPAWDGAPGWEDQPDGRDQPSRPDRDGPGPNPAGPGGSPLDPSGNDEIDFDLDGSPTITLGPVPPAGGRRPPQPHTRRPSPRPRRQTEPAPAGAVVATVAGHDRVSELVTTYPSAHPGPAGAINGFGVTVLVSDLRQSAAFYRDRLGFYEVDGGEGSVVLASGETRLLLRQAPNLGTVKQRLVHLNLEVADIDSMYAELKANGIRFLYPPRPVSRSARLELWAAAFRDPDGHGIALTQWRAR
jgi:catechol 2,3-dioxygenase-like lactoylglutathione lyase family enzyme